MVEFFWGLGLPVVFESTFLQVFLRNLGGTNFQIGLLPVILSLGIPLLSLLSAYWTTHLPKKKNIVFATNIIASLPILTLGLILRTNIREEMIIYIFYGAYALFAFAIGLLLPVWQNFLVKIFLKEDTLKAISIMHISQSITRIISGFALLVIVDAFHLTKNTASMIFTGAGIFMFTGSLFFLGIFEITHKPTHNSRLKLDAFIAAIFKIFKNKPFVYFLLNDICFFALINIISFYAIYAVEYCNIEPSHASGLFIVFSVTGTIIFIFIFGIFNVLSYKYKFYLEKTMGLAGILILLFFPVLSGFLIASFVFGGSRAIRSIAYAPVVKQLSGSNDATSYFAVASIIILPFSAGLPVISGKLLDFFEHTGPFSFQIMFSIMGLFILLSLFFLSKINIDG